MFRLAVPGLDAGLTRRVGFPALGLSRMLIQAMACSSYSRLPHISHIQAGKFVTVINSSPSQVKYVICRRCITPAAHSLHGEAFGADNAF